MKKKCIHLLRNQFLAFHPTDVPSIQFLCTRHFTNHFSLFDLLFYRVDYRPDRGIYDLQIKNISYIRDNGRFECRIKAKGTGALVHSQAFKLTVLTPPQPPLISTGNVATATEDKQIDLECSSVGGSPDPTIS